MAGIFISYRRSDSDHALTLYLWLLKKYGRERLFWDQKDIAPGRDFLEIIEQRIEASDALIAVIGRTWLTPADESGRRRIDDPEDVLRREISAALRKGILVLPVLGSGASMPDAGDLPDEVAALSQRQALKITDMQFHTLLEEGLVTAGVHAAEAPAYRGEAARIARRAGSLLRRQTSRLQVRAKELMREGKPDRVEPELNEGIELLMALLDLLPGEEGMDLELGYLFGAYGRLFIEVGARERADRYLDLALHIFQRVNAELALTPESSGGRASAIKGIGEVHYNRGDLHEAIRWYREALEVEPAYSYAWHDMFGAYDALAARNEIHLHSMRAALEGLKASSVGTQVGAQPGLDAAYLASLESRLRRWEGIAVERPHLVAGAEARLTATRAEDPNDAEAYYQRARSRASRNDTAGAIADYSAAIEGGKQETALYLERGGLCFGSQRYADAERDFTAALERGQQDRDVYFWRGRARLALHNGAGAVADFTHASAIGHPEAYFYRGLAHALVPDLSAADADFSRAIDSGARRPDAYRWRGATRAQAGDHPGAVADLTAALEHGWRDAELLYELGNERMAVADAAGAELAFSAAIDMGRDDGLVYLARAMARATRGDGAAAADFQAAIDRGTGQPFVHYMLGKVKSWVGDTAGVEASVTTAIAGGYDEAPAFSLRGTARSDSGDYAGAEADFSQAIARGGDEADLSLKRAMSRLRLNDTSGAERDFTTCIERNGQLALAYYGRALVHSLRGDAARLFDDCSSAIEHGAADAPIYKMRARAAARLGRVVVAEADCSTLEALAPDGSDVHVCRGDLDLARGDHERAAQWYRSSIELSPSSLDPQVCCALALAQRLAGRIDESEETLTAFAPGDSANIAMALNDLDLWGRDRPALADATANLRARLEARMAAPGDATVQSA